MNYKITSGLKNSIKTYSITMGVKAIFFWSFLWETTKFWMENLKKRRFNLNVLTNKLHQSYYRRKCTACPKLQKKSVGNCGYYNIFFKNYSTRILETRISAHFWILLRRSSKEVR